jgi:hypothetical protein
MPSNLAPAQALIDAANHDWDQASDTSARELLARLGTMFRQKLQCHSLVGQGLRFTLDLSDIHLSGLHNAVPCILLGGSTTESVAAQTFWKEAKVRDDIAFVICTTEAAYQAATETIPEQRALILAPAALTILLASGASRTALTQALWKQFGRTRLNPYNILQPAEGNMFFGRRSELNSLLWDQQSSFAIAGPSRIGKSSLLKRYKWELHRRRDPRRERTFLIDFYDCSDASPDSVARHIAVRMDESWSGSRSAHQITQTLKARSQSLKGRLELLLDEVDDVCFSRAFDFLAEAARNGYVRLILSGRANLLNTMLNPKVHLAQRLKLLRPEPLEAEPARALFTRPLTDLGFRFSDEKLVVDHVLEMTGRLPSLLQYYGTSIVDLAVRHGADVITMNLVAQLEDRLETVEHFLDPVCDLHDHEAMQLAILILRDKRTRYRPDEMTKLAEQVIGLRDPSGIIQLCNDLLIQNVLAWEDGAYRISNGALRSFAKRFGLLSKQGVG